MPIHTFVAEKLGVYGLDLSHVVFMAVYVRDMADFTAVNEVYGQYFSSQPPSRSEI